MMMEKRMMRGGESVVFGRSRKDYGRDGCVGE